MKKSGFRATQVRVEYTHEHVHRHLSHILEIIDRGQLTARQKDTARRIFTRLAQAEAKVHGVGIEQVHFHEVGAADAIADIVGASVGWDLLGVDRIVASPVPTGTGRVKMAHGECSIPAPATAELLQGVPLAESKVPFELTTPTGAAILTTLAQSVGPMPAMVIERIGYGAGQRDIPEQPNLLRLLVGTASDAGSAERLWMVETNLDDVSGEWVGYCTGRLWELGVLDVYTTAIQMKKNRPGVKLSVLCQASQVEQVEAILFAETTTLGARRWPVDRHVLARQAHQVDTPWGPIEGKIGWLAGQPRFSPEFESCRRIAIEQRVPLPTVYETAIRAFDPKAVKE